MSEHTVDERLTKYLTDVHSIEEQAPAQLRLAPRVAGDPELRRIYADICARPRSRNPDTPGKLAMHTYSYEHMELAAYELLRRIVERAGNEAIGHTRQRAGVTARCS